MKLLAISAALVSVLPSVLGQQLTVNTVASIVQCQPVQFTWSGGTPPYYLSLLPGGQPSAAALKQFPTQQGTSYTWNVDLQSGTSFSTSLKDSSGAVAYSDIQTINAGPDSSCLNASVTVGGDGATSAAAGASSPAAAASTPAAAPASSSPAAAASPSAAATVKTSATGASAAAASGAASKSSSTTPSASTTAKDNSAVKGTSLGALGMAGLMGLVGAALF